MGKTSRSGLRVVIGLGNPGARYANTRHNAGFLLADALVSGASWKSWPGGSGEYLTRSGLVLGKPLTYMNESGRFVSELARFYKTPPCEVLICFDDMDIPLGHIRFREKGSAGGHNGMRSIIESLGTNQIPRLRLGIGPRPAEIDAASFVLNAFKAPERAKVSAMISLAKEAVLYAAGEGDLSKAMTRYNAAVSQSLSHRCSGTLLRGTQEESSL